MKKKSPEGHLVLKSWAENSSFLEAARDEAICRQLKLCTSTADLLQMHQAGRAPLINSLCSGTKDSYGPDRSLWKMKNILAASSISIFQFLSEHTLIVPILHSGDRMSDSKCSGGVIHFDMEVCSLFSMQ